jgi:hypothetical protein
MAADLIGEYLLMIHPLVLGNGRRLFPGGTQASLRLVDSISTSTGVLIATYEAVRGYETKVSPPARLAPSSAWREEKLREKMTIGRPFIDNVVS